jgi:hypothetical protein
VVTAIATTLALQGWKSRVPSFDMITTIEAAAALVEDGHVPNRGVLTSLWSFASPGAAWLMAPGLLTFDDPRLFGYIGSVAIFACTLWGVFLLARRCIGSVAALLAATLYAVSPFGLSAASSLWQRYPIQCFTVWTVYFVVRWVETNDHRMLATAVVVLASGLYVFLEMAPVALVIPVVWLLWRPAWRPTSAAAALLAAFLIWLPYLQFERERHFLDLWSLIERQALYRPDFGTAWCDPSIAPASWFDDFARAQAADAARSGEAASVALTRWLGDRAGAVPSLVFANFQSASDVPGARIPLLLLTFIGLLALSADAALDKRSGRIELTPGIVIYVSVGIAAVAVLCNELLLARFLSADRALDISSVASIRAFQAFLLTTALASVAFRQTLTRQINQLALRWAGSPPLVARQVLTLGIVVPWAMLLLLSESDRGEDRFQWIWPLQTIALSASVTYVFRRFGMGHRLQIIGAATVVILVAGNPLLRTRVQGWLNEGWSGRNAIEIQVVDAIAEDLEHSTASIGYDIELWRFTAMFNVLDARYKAGANFDLLLKYRHEITNRNECAEGLSPEDTYRVVQTSPADPHPEARHRLGTGKTVGFMAIGRAGPYEIFARR